MSERVAIFDLDGTLADAVPDIAEAANGVLHIHGLAPLARREAEPLMGDGLRAFAQRAFALRGASAGEDDIALFIERYGHRPAALTRLYPGVRATLPRLVRDGWYLAVCSNKMERLARDILARLNILGHFDVVCGGDAVPFHKPDPRHLGETLARADLLHRPAVMIGDHRADVEAARAYGIPCIFAAWGYGTPDMAHGAAGIARTFDALPALLDAALPAGAAAPGRVP